MDVASTRALSNVRHLVGRFFLSLWPVGPSAESEAWAQSHLLSGEVVLWGRMSGADRRHAIAVARRVESAIDEPDRPVLAAALLHDVGKVDSALGTPTRVVATVIGLVGGHRASASEGRIGRYLRHPCIGADLLAAAGSDGLTVAWAAEHHLSAHCWTVDPVVAGVLHASDND